MREKTCHLCWKRNLAHSPLVMVQRCIHPPGGSQSGGTAISTVIKIRVDEFSSPLNAEGGPVK